MAKTKIIANLPSRRRRATEILGAVMAASTILTVTDPSLGETILGGSNELTNPPTNSPSLAAFTPDPDRETVVATSDNPGADAEVSNLPAVASNIDSTPDTPPQPAFDSGTMEIPEAFPPSPLVSVAPPLPVSPSLAPIELEPSPPLPIPLAEMNLTDSPGGTLGVLSQNQTTPPPVIPPQPTQTTPPPVVPPQPTPTQPRTEPVPSPGNQTPPPVTPGGRQTQPTPPAGQQRQEPDVLVAEVAVSGVEGQLKDEVYRAISLRAGRTTTRSELQQDINAIFATGYFAKVRAEPEDTPLGVRVTFVVEPNPELSRVEVKGNQVLPQNVVDEIFSPQYGQILNLRQLQVGIRKLNQWYQDNGYILAQVIDVPQVNPDGSVTLEVAEGTVENVKVQFLNKDGEPTDANGEPVTGRTKEYIITRELQLTPGGVFNRTAVEQDLQRVFGLGIFEDVRLSLNPGSDPRQVEVVVNVIEKNTGSVAAGAGVSSASGLFGTVSYQEQNLFGRNQKLGGELQVGEREILYDLRFTDPWIKDDPYRTSYTVNGFRRRSISLIFDGGDEDVKLPNGDRPRILRFGGGVNFSRPINPNLRTSLGVEYQRVAIRDAEGDISPRDELGNTLSFSDSGKDDLLMFQFATLYDRRDSVQRPTKGTVLRLSTEQSVPIGSGNILLNRLRGSLSYYLPVSLVRYSKDPQSLAFNFQAGTVIGDLPPYEAFSLGGSSTVRGYDEGELGTGRSYVQATAEYRFPVFSVVSGALFFDAASDLGTGSEVPGDPAGVRGKPGSGFGYGLGVRIQSPLGPIRVDYGISDEGEGRFHFGLGERF